MMIQFFLSTDYSTWVWLILVLATIGLEIMTEDLVSIWFSVGALAALILSALNVGVPWQVAIFLTVSVALLATVGKWSRKMIKTKIIHTNADSLINQQIIILKAADHLHSGEGKIRGVTWTVLCDKDDSVEIGDIAVVVRIDGNKLIVKK